MTTVSPEHAVAAVLVLGVVLGGVAVAYPGVIGEYGIAPDSEDTVDGADDGAPQSDDPDGVGEYLDGGEQGQGIYDGVEDITTEHELNHTYSLEDAEKPWFKDVTEQRGLYGEFTMEELENHETQEGEHGSGVFVSDVDGSGREDVLGLVNFQPVLFENVESGFSESNLVDVDVDVTSALFFDHDNSGYEDLYLLSDEGSVFLENVGGEFREREVGLEIEFDSVRGATAADYTGDGCLDVFVYQANDWQEVRAAGYDERISIEGDNGNPNRLFAGDCGTFEETTAEAGIEGDAWSLAASFVDLTGDGYPEIHVANDFNNDVVYFNEGDGSFERRVLPEFTDRNGMSSEVADVTGDGELEVFVSNVYDGGSFTPEGYFAGRVQGNNLLRFTDDRDVEDVADDFEVRRSGWGWSAAFADLDNDGDLDLYQATTDFVDRPNILWTGTDDSFELVTPESFGKENTEGNGVLAFDYNGDGQLDLLESAAWLPNRFYLYENQRNVGNHLRVEVEGDGEHTTIGSRVEASADGDRWTRVKKSHTDYLSQSSRILHFGVGEHESIDELTVEWPDGTVQSYEDVDVNQELVVSPDGSMQPR